MSREAEEVVEHVIHPEMSRSTQALVRTIAKLIAEGGTMTPVKDDGEMGELMGGYNRRTVLTARGELVDWRIVRAHGRRGQRGTAYELLLLPAAGGVKPRLPFIDVVPRRRLASSSAAETTLFDHPSDVATIDPLVADRTRDEVRAYDVGSPITGWWVKVRSQITGWRSKVRNKITGWRFRSYDVGSLITGSRSAVDVDDARARGSTYYYSEERTTTTTAPRVENPTAQTKPPPCRWHGRSHAWCDWRVHVPMELHREERAKLPRLPGETDADLDAKMFTRYARLAAAIPDDQAIPDKDGFAFWKRVLRSPPPQAVPREPHVERDTTWPNHERVWDTILLRIETRVTRHAFNTWFKPLVQVTDTGSVIEVAKPGASRVFADWIHKHHADVLRAAVEEVRPGARVDVIDIDELDRKHG